MQTTARISRIAVAALVLALAVLLGIAPQQDSAAFLVALLCAGAGLFGISLLRDERERALLLVLFCAAFVLRLLFSTVVYKTGLVSVLGGADDTVWEASWARAQQWKATGPDPWWNVFTGELRKNNGFEYFSALFFYVLDVRSQMALAFLNSFGSALTVVVIYKVAREFFDERASLFAAGAAALLPAFLVWASLTLKETWVILFEITTLFAVLRCSRNHKPAYGILALVLIVLTVPLRFYIGGVLGAAALFSFFCLRSPQPARTAVGIMIGGALIFGVLTVAGVVHFDMAAFAQSRVQELVQFRTNVSGGSSKGTSSVTLNYDITTPGGATMMLLVGSAYLLLSPFPWELNNMRQFMALPDVLLWWGLVFVFILPGLSYAWRRQPAALISIAAFVLPLVLFYSIIFGNVGLVYRQRAQLMPFFLILAAAGHEKRRQQTQSGGKRLPSWSPQTQAAFDALSATLPVSQPARGERL